MAGHNRENFPSDDKSNYSNFQGANYQQPAIKGSTLSTENRGHDGGCPEKASESFNGGAGQAAMGGKAPSFKS